MSDIQIIARIYTKNLTSLQFEKSDFPDAKSVPVYSDDPIGSSMYVWMQRIDEKPDHPNKPEQTLHQENLTSQVVESRDFLYIYEQLSQYLTI